MKIKGINPRTIMEDIIEATTPWSFENYCLPCINFDTKNCPFRGKVWPATDHRDIHCRDFWD